MTRERNHNKKTPGKHNVKKFLYIGYDNCILSQMKLVMDLGKIHVIEGRENENIFKINVGL